jgi:chloramphenicol O-acetyltransferase
MDDIETYKNQVELLKQALLFYADKDNYSSEMENPALIDLDEQGSQARFVLEQLKKIEEVNEKMKEDYSQFINDTINDIESNPINLTNTIETIKNINDNNI